MLFGFLASSFTHGALILALVLKLGHGKGGSAANGHAGAGDTSVDISVAGGLPSPPAPPVTETPPPPKTPDESEMAMPKPLPRLSKPVPPGNAPETHTGALAGPTRIGAPIPGAGGDTVDGQRQRLPGAVVCKDPVAGKWSALKYNPVQGNWVNFTLLVHKGEGGMLAGTILSHTWSGTPFDSTPPRCLPGGYDMTVSMNAHGRTDEAGRIRFGSSSYSIVAITCPNLDSQYAPDNFSGTIDATRQEFQSVNNDGFTDINAPYVFRRTGCLD